MIQMSKMQRNNPLSRVGAAIREIATECARHLYAGVRWSADFIRRDNNAAMVTPQVLESGETYTPPIATKSLLRLGGAIITFVFGGILVWSIAFPLEGAVVAGGQVVVEGNRKTIQHLEGGVVDEILVREGQQVDSGELVIRMKNTEQQTSLAVIDSQLTELYARRARLIAVRDNLDALSPATGITAILESAQFDEKLRGQRNLFEAFRKTRDTQVNLLNERVVQQTDRINGLDAQIRSLGNQLRLINDELASTQELHSQGFAPLTRVRELERERERLNGERGARRSSRSESESVISEAKLEIERLGSGMREDAISELRDLEVSIAELEEKRVAAAEAFARTEVRAPQEGWVLGLSVHTVGGVVAPGAPLMDIVPGGDDLEIAVQIAPQHVDQVHVGQETLVRFSALGQTRTPEILGAVKSVSADSIVDEASQIAYYLAMIEMPKGATDTALAGNVLVPGMPVEAYIKTGKRSAMSYFMKPLTDSMARALREE